MGFAHEVGRDYMFYMNKEVVTRQQTCIDHGSIRCSLCIDRLG